tara:strand:+ start:2211 stop:2795 length:585 start_codon:yes stop_codon:yes gene_type:complete
MALASELTLSKTEVSQKIDLSQYFDGPISDDVKLQIGQAFVDRIVERSEDGKDVNGKNLPSYSKSYRDSEDFSRFGKSASDIDMTLRGNMLEGIDFETSGDDITIAVDDADTKKAHGNITGQEGKWKSKREFFGITESEAKEIARDFKEEFKDDLSVNTGTKLLLDAFTTQLFSVQQNAFNNLFDVLFNGEDNG